MNEAPGAGRAAGEENSKDASSDHYSYAVYADPAMAERFEGMRFSGPIGTLIAETQARQILAYLSRSPGDECWMLERAPAGPPSHWRRQALW